jgi:hypothetical protein
MNNPSEILGTMVLLAFIGLVIWSLAWVYMDAEQRGKSGCLLVILIGLFAWPIGLIIWLIARPKAAPTGPYRFDTSPSCPNCGYTIPAGVISCPHCGSTRPREAEND